MQKDVELALQLDLGLHLGLLALVITVVVSRLTVAKSVMREIHISSQFVRSGYAPKRVRMARLWAAIEMLLKLTALLSAFMVCWKSFLFFNVAEELVGPGSSAIDSGLFRKLWAQGEEITFSMIEWSVVVLSLLVLDYGISVVRSAISPKIEALSLPDRHHPRLIPQEWEKAPEALWESRIKEAEGFLGGEAARQLSSIRRSEGWRSNWPAWAKCVVAFRYLGPRNAEQDRNAFMADSLGNNEKGASTRKANSETETGLPSA